MASQSTAAANGGAQEDEDSVAVQVRASLRELTAPLKTQLAEIDRRLVVLNRERADLLEAKKEINKTIRYIEPSQASANGAGQLAEKGYAAKKALVEKYLIAHRRKLGKGFIAAELTRQMKAAGITPVISASMMLKIVRELHERGVVRADKIVKGGAQMYVLVGRD
jgi:hypothetical protein